MRVSKVSCDVCGTLQTKRDYCYVCGSKIHFRKPYSLFKTFIYTFSAFVMLFPANLLPMMSSVKLTIEYPQTIWGGVVWFYKQGDIFLAFVIWLASIFIPIFKILSLFWLVIMAKKGKNRFSYFATKLHKFIHLIGKFSMLDIFVVTIMTAFLQFGNVLHMKAGPAVVPFALVIILTMIATINFDTRLLWDGENNERSD